MTFIAGLLMSVLAPLTSSAPQGSPREGAYLSRAGNATISRESYRFDGRTLTAELAMLSANLCLTTETVVDNALTPERFHLAARGESGDAVLQELDVTFARDTATWRVTGAGAAQGSTPLTMPFAVMQNLQMSHVALMLLKYDRARGGRQVINAWVAQGGASLPVAVTLEGDSGSFEVASVTMQVWVDGSGWLRRAAVPAQGFTVEWQARLEPTEGGPPPVSAATSPPASVVESEYGVRSGPVSLSGTLTVPKSATGRVAVAVIVAGSGPTDRNGNSAGGIHPNTYAQLAWRLAERGVATWRYDKRGLGLSTATFDFSQATFDDYAGDVSAAVRALAADARFSRVVVLGHSEGAGLGVRSANQRAPVAGIALLAGMGRSFSAVLREQLASQFDEATMRQWDSAFARYLRGESPGDLPASLQPLVIPVNRRFIQTSAAYEPEKEIGTVPVPVLIVQGGTDFQITEQDARALAAARPDARLVIIPDANHVFKRAPSKDRGSQNAQYMDPKLPVVAELVDAVVGWIGGLK